MPHCWPYTMNSVAKYSSTPKRKIVDARLRALVEGVNVQRAAGFTSGRLFLDSVEQAFVVALVNGHAVRRRSAQMYRG
jgi:hypothetical protein